MKLKILIPLGSILFGSLLLGSQVQAASKYGSTYTSIKPSSCKTLSFDEEGGSVTLRCDSFRDIGVNVLEGDLRQSITLTWKGRDYPLSFWTHITQGFSVLGDLVEWRHIKNKPDQLAGMVVRLTESVGDDAQKTTSYLVVSKVTPGEVCVVGKVMPQVRENQNVKARAMAEQANELPCLGH